MSRLSSHEQQSHTIFVTSIVRENLIALMFSYGLG